MTAKLLTTAQRATAASAYRSVLRSAKLTFKNDQQTIERFKQKNKQVFQKIIKNDVNELTKTGEEVHEEQNKRFEEEIKGLFDLSKILRTNLVQGIQSKDGQKISLRITKETELGDNESIKKPKPYKNYETIKCCNDKDNNNKMSESAIERRERRRKRREQID